MTGGKGRISGTVFGAMVIGIISNGLNLIRCHHTGSSSSRVSSSHVRYSLMDRRASLSSSKEETCSKLVEREE